jgi:hypothetical protein
VTYCAAWKSKGTVFLLADTAVTSKTSPTTTHTSFGQLHAEVRGETVHEALLKLVPLGDGIVAAFSGEVSLANHCLDFIRDGVAQGIGLAELLAAMTVSLGPFEEDRVVELLIAASTKAGDAQLQYWDTRSGLKLDPQDCYQIGSLTSWHPELTLRLASQFHQSSLPQERVLAVMTAIVQSYGVHDNLIDMNVGGAIYGVRTGDGKVQWQPDTNFVLYDASFKFPAVICSAVRNNALAVRSTFTDDLRVFAHTTSLPTPDPIDDEWLASVRSQLDSGRSKYWVFLSTLEKNVTVVCRADVDNPSRLVLMKVDSAIPGEHENVGLSISEELMQVLRRPVTDIRDGSIPFRLTFLND